MDSQKRKRTAVACHYCRRRKRKCDGRQPVCTLCEEANNSECEYPITEENNRQISADHTAEILDRLHRLEESFNNFTSIPPNSHIQPGDHFTPHSYGPPLRHNPSPASAFPSPDYAAPLAVDPSIHVYSSSSAPRATGMGTDITAPMAIPMSHSTTTGSLLQSRSAKTLLGDYPSDVFLRVESKRSLHQVLSLTPVPLNQITFPTLSAETAAPLADNFFNLVNPQHPVLEREDFDPIYQDVVGQPLQRDIRTALVLIVLALGEAAVDTPDLTKNAWLPGVELFTPALQVLLATWFDSFGDNILLPQGLYLAALYYSYLSRPLQAWRLVHMASTSIQHFPIRHRSMKQPLEETLKHQPVTRLCWAIFVLECDIVAEHHLPRSGIDQVIENLPFPRCGNPPDTAMLYWLADLSARRLLNRIHHVMYDTANLTATAVPTASLISVSAELNHQLGAWFDLLPSTIKPDLNNPAPSVDEAIMILRYNAAGDIIFRPFLHQVCGSPPGSTPPDLVVENAKQCLYHCRQYLAVVEHRLKASCGSLEIVLHSTLAVILLLTLASLSPILSSAVPDIDTLQLHAILLVEKWAFPGSSIESMLSILRTMRAKYQILY
ncbi:C6 finger domain-containing protein [Colletotrichum truncatum]|uniref:C6 finger domain-containing protein n=1 Tax=Colletotrichum truncatum TaxID=5467 RepID=A0ACC3Z1V9_COLTU|nr:C6 finger domain-containing protein [Colletotrichum truncatum]KAF6781363.1 C6 finger domain-containing protein [Colletotrichum truncatum]